MSEQSFAVVLDILGDDRAEIADSFVGPPELDLTAEQPDSPFALAFRGSDGSELGRSGFHVAFETPHMPFPASSATVSVVRPLPEKTASVEVLHRENVLARIERTPSPPEVMAVKVRSAEDGQSALEITWSAVDVDSEALTFAVSLSVDDGKSYLPIRAGLRERGLQVPVAGLPGGASAVFKVVASDGFNTGEATSDPIDIPDRPPVAAILAPASGARLRAGDPLGALGTAFDPEAGVLAGEALQWLLVHDDVEVVLGTGAELVAEPLKPGHHRIRLVATDPNGQTSSDDIDVEVVDLEASRELVMAPVRAPDVNLLFSKDGQIEASDSAGQIVFEGVAGAGLLQSRVWPSGDKGTPGEGLTAYLYRVVLTDMVSDETNAGVASVSLEFGSVEPVDYTGSGQPSDGFVVVEGGSGTVGPSRVEQSDGRVTFTFDPPLRFGGAEEPGDDSFFFGLASSGPPTQAKAVVAGAGGERCVCLVTAVDLR